MKTFLFLTSCLCLCNRNSFLGIGFEIHLSLWRYIFNNMDTIFFSHVLFLLFPSSKLGVCACVHAVKHRSVVVCDFCWSVISLFIFLIGGCHILPLPKKVIKSAERSTLAWWKVLVVSYGAKHYQKYQTASVASLMPYLLHWSSCLFCVYQYFCW